METPGETFDAQTAHIRLQDDGQFGQYDGFTLGKGVSPQKKRAKEVVDTSTPLPVRQ